MGAMLSNVAYRPSKAFQPTNTGAATSSLNACWQRGERSAHLMRPPLFWLFWQRRLLLLCALSTAGRSVRWLGCSTPNALRHRASALRPPFIPLRLPPPSGSISCCLIVTRMGKTATKLPDLYFALRSSLLLLYHNLDSVKIPVYMHLLQ
jgi:hypothetical protein